MPRWHFDRVADTRLRELLMVLLGVSGVLMFLAGIVLDTTYAFPDVSQYGDAVLISPNRLALPAIAIGAVLGVSSAVLALRARHRARQVS
jgi:hypothetical protein